MAATDQSASPLPAWLMPIAALGIGALFSFIFTSAGQQQRFDESLRSVSAKVDKIDTDRVTGREVYREFERLWVRQREQDQDLCEQRERIAFAEGQRSAQAK